MNAHEFTITHHDRYDQEATIKTNWPINDLGGTSKLVDTVASFINKQRQKKLKDKTLTRIDKALLRSLRTDDTRIGLNHSVVTIEFANLPHYIDPDDILQWADDWLWTELQHASTDTAIAINDLYNDQEWVNDITGTPAEIADEIATILANAITILDDEYYEDAHTQLQVINYMNDHQFSELVLALTLDKLNLPQQDAWGDYLVLATKRTLQEEKNALIAA